ncbi:Hemopexin [Aspergillus saccharolyticus JOP 1030-1]|uniref:Hemopexin n=1 Tax=Aspergillus saccharolyticus JOP 1030-1 TaxID=1450539 RepID=A0A318ZBY5_9EURO|nr:Hemopexin [Aspergillus saccharolyticus JOP 1030-1]PYH44037.1 Hemopexin [Aspergillus saccharolyticus JOP 1030-1]
MVDAAYYHPAFKQTYFFGGRRYARIKFTPGKNDDEITWGPSKIDERWPSLTSLGFGTVDAVLPVEGSPDETYVFHGSRFARIKVVPESNNDTVVDGPWVITDKLKSLAAAGYDTIDAALPVPGKPGEVYIFRGTNYVRINLDQDKTVYGPAKLSVEWPALTKAGFDSVDAAFPVPEDKNGLAYFFRGDQYVKLKVIASAPDVINFGPKPIKDYWKSLDWI